MGRLLALAAAAMLTVGCAGARGPAASPSANVARPELLHVAPGSEVVEAQLIGPATGWALTASRLALTTDGGRTWTTITPAGVSASLIQAVTALDKSRFRLVVRPQSFGMDATVYTEYASNDAG